MKLQTQSKPPFYIFTSINGVLFDANSAFNVHGIFFPAISDPNLKDSSVKALNHLLSSLEEKYDTKLIITSKLRKNLPFCINYLKQNGLVYDKPIFSTPFKKGNRGKKIIDYMKSENLLPKTSISIKSIFQYLFNRIENDRKFVNYVVLDSHPSRLKINIPKSHIIETNYNQNSLTLEQVFSFLQQLENSELQKQ